MLCATLESQARFSICAFVASLIVLLPAFAASGHTLPVSYLRISATPEYLHVEWVFNPFELKFITELDVNRDGELDSQELKAKGTELARRVASAMLIKVGETQIGPESVGMDPDMSGHHVRLRAHYRIDARTSPVSIRSGMGAITSASHLVQTTFVCGSSKELAQLDSQSSAATFTKHLDSKTAASQIPKEQKGTEP
jgi:hypothetical protein